MCMWARANHYTPYEASSRLEGTRGKRLRDSFNPTMLCVWTQCDTHCFPYISFSKSLEEHRNRVKIDSSISKSYLLDSLLVSYSCVLCYGILIGNRHLVVSYFFSSESNHSFSCIFKIHLQFVSLSWHYYFQHLSHNLLVFGPLLHLFLNLLYFCLKLLFYRVESRQKCTKSAGQNYLSRTCISIFYISDTSSRSTFSLLQFFSSQYLELIIIY